MATGKKINISAVCRQLGYSKQAYYKSVLHHKNKRSDDRQVLLKVLAIRKYLPRLGVRKLYYLLRENLRDSGLSIGRDQLFALLGRERLLVSRKKSFTRTTDSRYWIRQHPDLIKDMSITAPEQACVSDITFIRIKNNFHYLHLVTDAYSKKIMGYCMSNNMSVQYTIKAMQMAIDNRQYKTPMIHHSDRGSQYCSAAYVQLLRANGIRSSTTQDGSPYDNAIAERINGILKDEFGMDSHFNTIQQAASCIQKAINIYNKIRPHLSCHMLTPQQMHEQNELPVKSWRKKSRRTLDSSSAFLPSPTLVNQST